MDDGARRLVTSWRIRRSIPIGGDFAPVGADDTIPLSVDVAGAEPVEDAVLN
jgi:hypothetical protein